MARAGLIDVHAHVITPQYVTAAQRAGHVVPDGMPQWPSWGLDTHLALMDQAGIATAVLSVSAPGVHFGDDGEGRRLARVVNDQLAGIRAEHPTRFGHFAALPLPDVEGALAEAAYALDELGSDGVGLMSNSGGRYLGDERHEPLWGELDRRGAVVFVHPTSPDCFEAVSLGRPRPMLEFIFETTRTVSDLAFTGVFERYPDIRWVFPHGGGALPLIADRMELFRTLILGNAEDGSPSIPQQLRALWFDMAGTPFPNQIPALVRAFGSEQVLYGSDHCFTPPPAVLAQIATIEAAEQPAGQTWAELTTRNARRLLPRLA